MKIHPISGWFCRIVIVFVFLLAFPFSASAATGQTNPTSQTGQLPSNTAKSWALGGDFGASMFEAITNNNPALGSTAPAFSAYTANGVSFGIGGCQINPDFCPQQTRGTSYEREINESSALGTINRGIMALYQNKPADLALWIDDTARTLGFKPHTSYAQGQGIGFNGLAPLLPIWKGFRNVAYALLAIFIIIVGFMVMFRKKIDPKTVVTVQNALPRVVLTLILITFSYAIVGLMIDLMYVLIALSMAMLAPAAGGSMSIGDMQNLYINGGIIGLFSGVFGPLMNLVNPFSGILSVAGSTLQSVQNGNAVQALLQFPGLVVSAATLVPGWLFTIILALVFLIGFLRILFMLLSAYIHVIFSVLIAPLQLLLEALPGGNGFEPWIKGVITNLAPFPITIFLLIIANWLAGSQTSSQLNALWVPPLLPVPLLGGQVSNFAYTLIWLGIIMSIPTIVGSIKEALKAKPPIPVGAGAVFGPAFSGGMGAMNLLYQGSMVTGFLGGHNKPPTAPGGGSSLEEKAAEAVSKGGKR